MLKACKKCGVEKDLIEEFYAHKQCKDGRSPYCKECAKAVSRAWALANPERAKGHRAKWLSDVERKRRKEREWKAANPEKSNKRNAEWARRHPEAVRAKAARRRALKSAYEGLDYTGKDVLLLLESQAGACAYCDAPLNADYHVDHIMPLSRGGGNGPDNICIACPRCNMSKGDRLLVEWRGARRDLDNPHLGYS